MMNDSRGDGQADGRRAGLCATCAHAKIIPSDRGSRYYMCRLSLTDPRFARYPVIPVVACSGYRSDREKPRE
jgi:hypothetical protein